MNDSVLDHPLLINRYFYPRREILEQPFLIQGKQGKLSCFFKQVNKQAKTIVFFHGNGEIVNHFTDNIVPAVTALDCNILLAEYSGFGMSDGKPSFTGICEDVKNIINVVEQSHENIIVFGRSLGSLFAVHAVNLFPKIGGLIIESGIADLSERIEARIVPEAIGISTETLKAKVSEHFNQQQKLSGYKGKTLIMHAQNDADVSVSNALKLYDWAVNNKTLKIFERGNHNTIFEANHREYMKTINDFIHANF